jgi:general secretion pathway protein G
VKKNIQSRRGFTLMEMLIVLSIIALLMGMVIYNLTGVNEMAQRQKVDSDLLSFKELLAAYQLESGTLPTTEQGLKALWEKPTAEPVPDRWKAMLDQEVKDPWGHPYQYLNPGKHNPDRYDVFSMGPDGQPDTDDDIGNWTSASAK